MKVVRKARRKVTKRRFVVAIFGSARVRKDEKDYKQVYQLAKELGLRGIDVVTGGGPGLMEAANSGLKSGSGKTKAHSIGLGIKLPKEQMYNKSLDIEETFMRFSRRLDNFMLLSNAVVVAPGGVGTLLELFYTWQLVQVKHKIDIPIILLGKHYSGLLDWLEKGPLREKYFSKGDFKMLYYAKSNQDALKVIDRNFKEFKKAL